MINLFSYKCKFSGKLILDYYNNNGKLNDGSRSILMEIIIAYMIRHDKQMSIKVAQDISLQIVSAFPTKIKVFVLVPI